MSERDKLMRKIQASGLVIWELHIFLDTHPENSDAMKKMNEEKDNLVELQRAYEEKFGPLTEETEKDNRWQWISEPWPWEGSEDSTNVAL